MKIKDLTTTETVVYISLLIASVVIFGFGIILMTSGSGALGGLLLGASTITGLISLNDIVEDEDDD